MNSDKAIFIGFMESGIAGRAPLALYNILDESCESHGSTVSAVTLKKYGIDVPFTPDPAELKMGIDAEMEHLATLDVAGMEIQKFLSKYGYAGLPRIKDIIRGDAKAREAYDKLLLKTATLIAIDHLKEIPNYYTRLKKMEADAGVKNPSMSEYWQKHLDQMRSTFTGKLSPAPRIVSGKIYIIGDISRRGLTGPDQWDNYYIAATNQGYRLGYFPKHDVLGEYVTAATDRLTIDGRTIVTGDKLMAEMKRTGVYRATFLNNESDVAHWVRPQMGAAVRKNPSLLAIINPSKRKYMGDHTVKAIGSVPAPKPGMMLAVNPARRVPTKKNSATNQSGENLLMRSGNEQRIMKLAQALRGSNVQHIGEWRYSAHNDSWVMMLATRRGIPFRLLVSIFSDGVTIRPLQGGNPMGSDSYGTSEMDAISDISGLTYEDVKIPAIRKDVRWISSVIDKNAKSWREAGNPQRGTRGGDTTTDGNQPAILKRDGVEKCRGTANECLMWMQRDYGMSRDYGFKYGGWTLEPSEKGNPGLLAIINPSKMQQYHDQLDRLAAHQGKDISGNRLRRELARVDSTLRKVVKDFEDGIGREIDLAAAVDIARDDIKGLLGRVPGLVIDDSPNDYILRIDSEYMDKYADVGLPVTGTGDGILAPFIRQQRANPNIDKKLFSLRGKRVALKFHDGHIARGLLRSDPVKPQFFRVIEGAADGPFATRALPGTFLPGEVKNVTGNVITFVDDLYLIYPADLKFTRTGIHNVAGIGNVYYEKSTANAFYLKNGVLMFAGQNADGTIDWDSNGEAEMELYTGEFKKIRAALGVGMKTKRNSYPLDRKVRAATKRDAELMRHAKRPASYVQFPTLQKAAEWAQANRGKVTKIKYHGRMYTIITEKEILTLYKDHSGKFILL